MTRIYSHDANTLPEHGQSRVSVISETTRFYYPGELPMIHCLYTFTDTILDNLVQVTLINNRCMCTCRLTVL